MLSLLLIIVEQLSLSFLGLLHFGLSKCNEMVMKWFSYLQLRLSIAFRQVAENSTNMVMVMVMAICIVFSVIGIVENIVGPTMWVVSYSVSLALYSTLVLYSMSVGLTHSQLPLQLEVHVTVHQCNCERSYHVTVRNNCATMLLSTCATVQL